MSDAALIAVELREIQGEIARVERLVAEHPEYPSLLIDHGALAKRQGELERAFAQATSDKLIDICGYRFIPDSSDRYPILAIGRILTDFQELVTTVFDAFRTGKPKSRARPSAETVQLSTFDFAYAASGSLRVAMTIPNERLILVETDIDRAMSSIFTLMKAPSPAAISELAEVVGIASIKKLFELADEHKKNGLSADVTWRRNEQIRERVVVQTPEFEALCGFIEERSSEELEPLSLRGRLAGLDVDLGTFHMTFAEGADISGRLAKDFAAHEPIQVPANYTADIMKHTVIFYSTKLDKVTYELMRLRPF